MEEYKDTYLFTAPENPWRMVTDVWLCGNRQTRLFNISLDKENRDTYELKKFLCKLEGCKECKLYQDLIEPFEEERDPYRDTYHDVVIQTLLQRWRKFGRMHQYFIKDKLLELPHARFNWWIEATIIDQAKLREHHKQCYFEPEKEEPLGG
ncbi:hypothetical protein NHQ30_004552 [Ciborinia camelliae]|nr:hypothetical protein NHQ30_004552 [Ciborinia camelliae]